MELSSDAVVARAVVRMAGDLETVRKILTAFTVIFVVCCAIWVLAWMLGGESHTVTTGGITPETPYIDSRTVEQKQADDARQRKENEDLIRRRKEADGTGKE